MSIVELTRPVDTGLASVRARAADVVWRSPIALRDLVADRLDMDLEGGRIAGPVRVDQVRDGLKLTAVDLVLETELEARFDAEPSIFIGVCLAGAMETGSAHDRTTLPSVAAATTIVHEQVPWRTRSLDRGPLRVVHAVMSSAWLDHVGIRPPVLDDRQAFVTRVQPASAALAAVATAAIELDGCSGPIGVLRREATALQFVAAFAASCWESEDKAECLSPRARKRIAHMLEVFERQADQAGPLPGLSDLAKEAGMSSSSLCRLFREAKGESLCAYLTGLKLERARRSLAQGDATIMQAAHIAGYTSSSNFITAFKRRFGSPPGALTGTAPRRMRVE